MEPLCKYIAYSTPCILNIPLKSGFEARLIFILRCLSIADCLAVSLSMSLELNMLIACYNITKLIGCTKCRYHHLAVMELGHLFTRSGLTV
jgi:hypothetical protein